ncbi:hypothetical protein PENTCL1PPCAC_17155, partial [Pristionchus entomophagus]
DEGRVGCGVCCCNIGARVALDDSVLGVSSFRRGKISRVCQVEMLGSYSSTVRSSHCILAVDGYLGVLKITSVQLGTRVGAPAWTPMTRETRRMDERIIV